MSELLSDIPASERHPADEARRIRAYARRLYAEVAVRVVAIALDVAAIAFAVRVVRDHVPALSGASPVVTQAIILVGLCIWFSGSWVGPLRATPFQFVFGMQVLHVSGRALRWQESLLRVALLIAVCALAVYGLKEAFGSRPWISMVIALLLIYLPSITARRQAVHDLLAGSIVVNRRAIAAPADAARMREFLGDAEPVTQRSARPSIPKMLVDGVVLAIPFLLLMTGLQVAQQKNLYGRMAYAMGEVYELRSAARAYFLAYGGWPRTEEEFGRSLRQNYPDGGYYELDDTGTIRIQFEVVPELSGGTILLEPLVAADDVTWQCRVIGNIEARSLPGDCRDAVP